MFASRRSGDKAWMLVKRLWICLTRLLHYRLLFPVLLRKRHKTGWGLSSVPNNVFLCLILSFHFPSFRSTTYNEPCWILWERHQRVVRKAYNEKHLTGELLSGLADDIYYPALWSVVHWSYVPFWLHSVVVQGCVLTTSTTPYLLYITAWEKCLRSISCRIRRLLCILHFFYYLLKHPWNLTPALRF
jgi:hypothetical protein